MPHCSLKALVGYLIGYGRSLLCLIFEYCGLLCCLTDRLGPSAEIWPYHTFDKHTLFRERERSGSWGTVTASQTSVVLNLKQTDEVWSQLPTKGYWLSLRRSKLLPPQFGLLLFWLCGKWSMCFMIYFRFGLFEFLNSSVLKQDLTLLCSSCVEEL